MANSETTNEKLSLIMKLDTPLEDGVKFNEDGGDVWDKRGVSMTWKNLTVTADIETQHLFRNSTHISKEIIHNVNGYVNSSNLVAILGASGSGKSTLMSVLANRQLGELNVSGDIRVNGRKVQLNVMKSISGFVYQDDLFITTLTVLEHLRFAAQLKLDKRISADYREKLINDLLIDVGLSKNANCLIGSSSYGEGKMNLSGGELKRLSVASELLTNPPLLFCDEPTTGLDSFTALKLMMIMRKMTSQRNKTIICSIHQPSEKIFDLFHQIILLHEGKIAFIGNTKDALDFFKSIGFNYNEKQNPADYLVKCLAVVPGQEVETTDRASNVCLKFEQSQYAKYINDKIRQESLKKAENFHLPGKIKRISWFYMLFLLTYRNVLGTLRDPSIQNIRILNKAMLALILGIFMMGSATMTQEGIQALKGMLFTMVTENSFPPMDNIIDHFPNKMFLFHREYLNNMNTPFIFYLSNIISLIPGFCVDAILFTIIMYTLLGLRYCWFAFLGTIAINVLINNTAAMLGTLVSLATDNVFIAESITLTVGLVYISFAGIFMNVRSIPWIFSWIRYVSWMTYAVECLLILQLKGVDEIQCSKAPNVPCLKNGEEVLKSLGFDSDNFLKDITMISYVYLILHVLNYFTLRIRLYLRTNR